MGIKEDDEWKTTFKTHYNFFKYQVMSFGLTNVPAIFQGFINKILAEKLDVFVIIYLDNILIYIKSGGKEYVEVVQWVLDQLQKYLLYANLKKYQFHQDEVRFLGCIVFHQGIRIEKKQIKTKHHWLEPQSVHNIQVFLRFTNFYWQFI